MSREQLSRIIVTGYICCLYVHMRAKRDKKRANLRDVARVAGVSVATVSRVMNTPDVVQKDTRERVEQAITQLGFHPSAAARAINTGRTKIIGALIPTLDSDIFAITVEAIENRLGEFGFSLVVATTDEDPAKEARRAKELLDIGAEGLFVTGVEHDDALFSLVERTNIPTVAISYYDPEFVFPTIGYDNRRAANIALEHLLDLGHRHIAVVHGPVQNNDRTRERVAGTATPRDDVVLSFHETDLTVNGGAGIAGKTMEQRVDAFLCMSDVQAFGIMFELQRMGLAVPKDVSVMGLHDLPSAKSMYPRLSTIHLPAQEMGHAAAEGLANWVENETRPPPICFPSQLIARESTGFKRGNGST